MLVWKRVAALIGTGWIGCVVLACSDDDAFIGVLDLGGCPDVGTCRDAAPALDLATARDMGSRPDASTEDVILPPSNGAFDYQIGGDYDPPAGVVTVSRDRGGTPAPGLYNICYVNGFQIQPGEIAEWDADLVLRDGAGDPIIDPDWNEALLDVSTSDKRLRVSERINGWIADCGSRGFDAIEVDNLDTFTRSGGRLSADDAVALMALLSLEAHRRGLAIGQKNTAELLARRAAMGTDFAVVEECSRYDECGNFVAAYGDAVVMVEYRRADFDKGCTDYGATHGIVLRDLDVLTPTDAGYLYDGC